MLLNIPKYLCLELQLQSGFLINFISGMIFILVLYFLY